MLSSAFAAPGITKEWGIGRAALGIVLSAELVGMGFGSVILGSVADKAGRKPAMLGCLVIMAVGMHMAPAATGVDNLTIWRFITGLGIGAHARGDQRGHRRDRPASGPAASRMALLCDRLIRSAG